MSTTLQFYSDNDLQHINDNLDQIEINALKETYRLLDPTDVEYNKVRQVIIDFIKEQGRIIYGGSAYHAIVQKYKSKNHDKNTIYPEWSRYDTEFYSPDPIRDMIMICNRLEDNNIKYIMGRQAQHNGNIYDIRKFSSIL